MDATRDDRTSRTADERVDHGTQAPQPVVLTDRVRPRGSWESPLGRQVADDPVPVCCWRPIWVMATGTTAPSLELSSTGEKRGASSTSTDI